MEQYTLNNKIYQLGVILNGKFVNNIGRSLTYEEVCTIKKEMEQDKKKSVNNIKRQKTSKSRII